MHGEPKAKLFNSQKNYYTNKRDNGSIWESNPLKLGRVQVQILLIPVHIMNLYRQKCREGIAQGIEIASHRNEVQGSPSFPLQ